MTGCLVVFVGYGLAFAVVTMFFLAGIIPPDTYVIFTIPIWYGL